MQGFHLGPGPCYHLGMAFIGPYLLVDFTL